MLSMYIFVVADRIHNLVTYLQEFRSLGHHLLLNTYTKLKDIVHLDNFIKDRKSGDDDVDPEVVSHWLFFFPVPIRRAQF